VDYSQLDAKLIRNGKDSNMKGNIKRARFYTRKVHKDGMAPFVTDDSDVTGKLKKNSMS